MFPFYPLPIDPKDARKKAEDKATAFLEVATEAEVAYLFNLLRHSLDWTSQRAQLVLKKCGWWLP